MKISCPSFPGLDGHLVSTWVQKCKKKVVDPVVVVGNQLAASSMFVHCIGGAQQITASVCQLPAPLLVIPSVLNDIVAIADKTIRWIPFLNGITFAVSAISLGMMIEQSKYSIFLNRELHHISKKNANLTEILTRFLENIDKKEPEKFRSALVLSKKANAKNILHFLNQGVKAEKILTHLRQRARVDLSLKIAEMASKILFIVGTGLFFTPLAPFVASGIITVAATISLVCWTKKVFFVRKNPFDENSYSRAERAYHAVIKKVQNRIF